MRTLVAYEPADWGEKIEKFYLESDYDTEIGIGDTSKYGFDDELDSLGQEYLRDISRVSDQVMILAENKSSVGEIRDVMLDERLSPSVESLSQKVSGDYSSDENPFRIGEASYYLKNIEGDLGRAHQIAARRAASSFVNNTVRNGKPVENLDETLKNVTLNGSTNDFDTVVENSSLNSWRKTVIDSADESRYKISIEFDGIKFEDSQLGLKTKLNTSTRLEDPTTLAKFNNTPQRTNFIDFSGYEDTMLLIRSENTYINKYSKCGFQKPAENIATGTDSNGGATYGEATGDATSDNRGQKILVNNEPNNGEAFAGVITDDSVSYNGTKYVTGLDSDSLDIKEGQNLILYQDDVWHSRIREVLETGCYMRSDTDPTGPGIKERLKNELEAKEEENRGLETIIDKSRLPQDLQYLERTNVGYQYFRGAEGQRIAGITGDKAIDGSRDYRDGFRIDQDHIEEWGIQTLSY